MPNLPAVGVWGRPDELAAGPGSVMVDGVAALAGSTTPRQIVQVFVARANGTPCLVWAAVAQPVTGVARSYIAGGQVAVTWTVGTYIEADAFDVRRPDGSLVGTLVWNGIGTFVGALTDAEPRPIGGSYTVTARLGSTIAAPGAAATLDLSAPVTSLAASWVSPKVHLSWAIPAYGQPSSFRIYRRHDFTSLPITYDLVDSKLAGNVTSWDDPSPQRGVNTQYLVRPVLFDIEGPAVLASVSTPPAEPVNVQLLRTSNPSLPGFTTLTGSWTIPSGVHDAWEYAYGPLGVWETSGAGYNAAWPGSLDHAGNFPDGDPPTPTYFRVRTISNATGVSAWVTVGPV